MLRCRLFLLWVLLVVAIVTPSPVAAADAVPAAGTMIFHADGSTGVPLTGLPKQFPFEIDKDVRLELDGASFGMTLFDSGAHMCGEREAVICPRFGRYSFGAAESVFEGGAVHGSFSSTIETDGSAEVYIVADGPVTVTMRIGGLSGTTEMKLRGQIDVTLERLPVRCPATDCTNVQYGGATHALDGHGGFASAYAMSWNSTTPPAADVPNRAQTNSVIPCAYPHWRTPDASPDPSAHPTGCDFIQEDGTFAEQHVDNAANFAIQAADVLNPANARSFPNYAARGEVYLGYVAERYSPLDVVAPGGGVEAFGVWLHDGITCPASNCVVPQ